jgi:hypothetical protein
LSPSTKNAWPHRFLSHPSASTLHEPMIEDMGVRGFTENTRRD